MIIRIICILGFLTMLGCSSDDGSSTSNTPVPKKEDAGGNPQPPKGKTKVKWGELSCQKSSNCENISFNLSKKEWGTVFSKLKTSSFPTISLSSSSEDEKSFLCGVKVLRLLENVDSSFLSLSGQDKINLVNFLGYALNVGQCEAKAEYESKMDEYINL